MAVRECFGHPRLRAYGSAPEYKANSQSVTVPQNRAHSSDLYATYRPASSSPSADRTKSSASNAASASPRFSG